MDNLNQLDNTHLPLDIGTAWLNSGFKYIDPSTCTKKYFYRDANTMVFEVPYNGADQDLTSPSSNLGSPRSELRGTLVNGSEDNWQPLGTHILEATCTVDAVNLGSGKVIIGQIHEKTQTDVASIVVNYNYPNAQDVSVTVKDNADGTDNPLFDPGNKDRNITLASGVPLRATIHYKVELIGTANSLTLTATFNNGTPQSRTMYQNGDPIWSDSTWLTSYFYFKAGCYFPHAPANSSAKVTFSSLKVTQP